MNDELLIYWQSLQWYSFLMFGFGMGLLVAALWFKREVREIRRISKRILYGHE